MQSNIVTFAKRSLSLSKIQAGFGVLLGVFGVFMAVVITHLVGSSGGGEFFLFGASFMAFSMLMVTTPVILLYVYDKNNGVLEYLLSIGWNQSDVFKQYLKAALLLALTIFLGESIAVIISGVFAGSQGLVLSLLTILLTGFLGFSVVALTTVAMMAFSSLQKQRVGGNSPLAIAIGVVFIIPTFYTSFLGFTSAYLVDTAVAALATVLSAVLLILSSKLIRREKMLP